MEIKVADLRREYQVERRCRLGGISIVVGCESLHPYKVRQAVVGRTCERRRIVGYIVYGWIDVSWLD